MNLHRNRISRELNERHPRVAWIYRVDQGRHLPGAAGNCRGCPLPVTPTAPGRRTRCRDPARVAGCSATTPADS
ncbi:hypothetical protein DM611_01815 [Stenotrophomonas maltophilia]|nr:hypothetical protein DM611_01815 [Stenotrophomonas maltophilia]MBA0362108.1 hypothetical protein [Stenotrophomonas maltophilia]